MKLLIVDDSSMLRDMLVYTLNEGGYSDIVECVDGLDALNQAKVNQFDLVLTDINMPNMHGLELIKELKKIELYADVPILILTTENSNNMKQEAKDAGAKGWIVKPFVPEQLLKAVNTVLNKN